VANTTRTASARATQPEAGAVVVNRRRRYSLLTRHDKLLLVFMIGIPLALDLILVWGPTLASIALSFTNWDGIGDLTSKNFVGLKNYQFLFTGYTLFWPAFSHNVIWLLWLTVIATPLGILLAVLLDREIRGSRIYQSIFFLPVVLALAVVALIWEIQYTPTDGFINNALGIAHNSHLIDWLGNPHINLYSALVAASWRHIGYVMILYLAGLKSVDPSLKEAARVDGATEVQSFFNIVLPVMAPINVVIVVVTAIESLRAFDIAFIINQGKNGLELLSILITSTSVSEATLVGFGSAIAVVLLMISIVPIVTFLTRVMRNA
jgi:ABC-type sugar transport system permease subunit